MHIGRYTFSGIVTVIPLWITWVVFEFVLRQLAQFGRPSQSERQILQCLGAPVVMEWNELPTDVQRALFKQASAEGPNARIIPRGAVKIIAPSRSAVGLGPDGGEFAALMQGGQSSGRSWQAAGILPSAR